MDTTALDKIHARSQRRIDKYELKKIKLIENLKLLETKKISTLAIHKNTSNLFRHRKPNNIKIDVRTFNNVLHVDPKNLVADVEGMTTYKDLVKECLQYSCLPAVVPELKSITVGGALAGGAIESSSFRYGLVHETILEFEALLSDGQIIHCRPDNEHRDLFYSFPNTYGTLGYALRIKLRLIPAKSYIKITHHYFADPKFYFEELTKICTQQTTGSIAYIEGVVFDPKNLYLTTGQFVDEAPYTNDYKYMNIYYRSIQKNRTDYLTSSDYIWRWDPDWFWCSKFFFMQNKILRFIFGKFLLRSTAYWKIRHFINKHSMTRSLLEKLQQKTESVIQDVQIPIHNATEFLSFFQKNIGIEPIWICPTMPASATPDYTLCLLQPNTLYINFGFWDTVPTNYEDGYYNKLVEKKVRDLNGYKGLYSNVYYTKDEFWNIYDQNTYADVKRKYDPQNRLKDLYTKCSEK